MADKILEGTHQVFIVQQLACFARAKDVQEALKQNFGIEISLQGVCYYDISNPELTKKLKTLFNSTRNSFLKDSSKIPISNKSYRLRKLQQMFESEENNAPAMQNKKAMRAILEQAAKESGDCFSNKQKLEHTGADGGAMQLETRVILPNVDETES